MLTNQNFSIYILSDSVGTTGLNTARAALAQFPDSDIPVHNFPFIKNITQIKEVLSQAKNDKAIVLHTVANKAMVGILEKYCIENDIECLDIMTPIVNLIERKTGNKPSQKAGELHKLDEDYFERIRALEFAVKYDDGKDPKGFLEADILLLGISRTSKTPLSIYLANQNFKVANLPLMPESKIPKEVWQIDSNKIVGLTNSEEVLLSFRKERMKAYGMNPDSIYSSLERIRKEIKYAENLYDKIGCLTINVSKKSIEETTAIIIKSLNLK